MNGKIERFFATLKNGLRHYTLSGVETLTDELALFRIWYNRVRPHQHLDGRTPAEAWNGVDLNRQSEPIAFSAWDGALAGFYLPPG